MEIRAVSKYVRISPRKTRLVADIVRGRNALESQQLLGTMNKRAARIIIETLNSAISNARQKEIKEEPLWIKEVLVDGGPLFKRYMPRAMGRATMIRRRTSHITVVLSDEERRVTPPEREPEVKAEQAVRKRQVSTEEQVTKKAEPEKLTKEKQKKRKKKKEVRKVEKKERRKVKIHPLPA